MTELTAAHFPLYFTAVHAREPFPWQSRMAMQVLEERRFPDVVAIPTGCGKTSVLDIALFALACQPEVFPRRILLVIDRRVVVDQGVDHAKKILRMLQQGENPIAKEVANRLRLLWGGKTNQAPFQIVTLRGGIPRDDEWAKRPDWPVLGVSTVDQVGSRLLFRGYGPSEMMASVHAGLLGHDTLFLLDEVHLSLPFAETLLALRKGWRQFYPNELPNRWDVVRLSATPGIEPRATVFNLPVGGEDDGHPVLRPRLFAHKPATLELVNTRGEDEDNKRAVFANAVAAAAIKCSHSRAGVTGIVVNRVATAHQVTRRLSEAQPNATVQLLTGRMRPLDRDATLKTLLPRISAGRLDENDTTPLFVVATQCIETGADFDFDALVTECASLDSLRQRFGRLNRLGRLPKSEAVVLARSDQVSNASKPDPIYGTALRNTWDWLNTLAPALDFGIRHLAMPPDDMLSTLVAPREHAPILLPSHIDAWSQTHPRPHPDPEISLWLHGPSRGEADIQIIWRADIGLLDQHSDIDSLIAKLCACPPTTFETLTVPLSAARRWLMAERQWELADVPMQLDVEHPSQRTDAVSRYAVRWNGSKGELVTGKQLRPGDTLVVPCRYGGLVHGNWNPDSGSECVVDLGDLAQWARHGRATLRLHPSTLPPSLSDSACFPLAKRNEDGTQDLKAEVSSWLAAARRKALPDPWDQILGAIAAGSGPRILEQVDGTLTLVARQTRRQFESPSTEDDGASFTEQEVSLDRHSRDVWSWANHFCVKLGIPEKIRKDIVLAAWLHDAGKADPRFQKWLVGGSDIRLLALQAALAKSAQTIRDSRAIELARQQAGYPKGYRHEVLSIGLVQKNRELLQSANDAELVLHLVGSHHGWCRPFAPILEDADSIPVTITLSHGPADRTVTLHSETRHELSRLGSGVADRFWGLTERYGWWGLAWLEAILRLADHRASAEGGLDA